MTQSDTLETLVERAQRQLHRAPPEVRAAFKELEGVWRRSLAPPMVFLPVTPPAPPVCRVLTPEQRAGIEDLRDYLRREIADLRMASLMGPDFAAAPMGSAVLVNGRLGVVGAYTGSFAQGTFVWFVVTGDRSREEAAPSVVVRWHPDQHPTHPAPRFDILELPPASWRPLASARAAIEERRAWLTQEKAILRNAGRSFGDDDRAPTGAVVRVNGHLGVVGVYQHAFREGTWVHTFDIPAGVCRKFQWHPDQGRWGAKAGNTLEILELPPTGWSDV